MDTTAASLLGDQLRDFFVKQFVKQFAPPPGTQTKLGFLGAGVAVSPDSFLSQGQFNPARVNSWLNIVIDPLGTITKDGDQVGATRGQPPCSWRQSPISLYAWLLRAVSINKALPTRKVRRWRI